MIISIYAISENGIIGKDNDLPWRLPADFRRFKKLTMGHPMIMGRKTWESLGGPLPGRQHIVVTRNRNYEADGALIAHSLEEALARTDGAETTFIIGGSYIFEEAMKKGLVDMIYETLVHAEVDGDVSLDFPDEDEWELVEVDAHQASGKNEYAYTYRSWQHKIKVARPQTGEYAPFYAGYISQVPNGDISDILEEQGEAFVAFLKELPQEKHDYAYQEGKWSIKEIVGHLSDTERVFAYRMLCFARNDQTELAGFDQDDYMMGSRFVERDFEEIVTEYQTVRAASLSLLRSLTANDLLKTGKANNSQMSVRALLYIIAGHERHHWNVVNERYM